MRRGTLALDLAETNRRYKPALNKSQVRRNIGVVGWFASMGGRIEKMQRFFFDCRDGDDLLVDAEGLEVAGVDEAMSEATKGLLELARDTVTNAAASNIAIEVRDEFGVAIGHSTISFCTHLNGTAVSR